MSSVLRDFTNKTADIDYPNDKPVIALSETYDAIHILSMGMCPPDAPNSVGCLDYFTDILDSSRMMAFGLRYFGVLTDENSVVVLIMLFTRRTKFLVLSLAA